MGELVEFGGEAFHLLSFFPKLNIESKRDFLVKKCNIGKALFAANRMIIIFATGEE